MVQQARVYCGRESRAACAERPARAPLNQELVPYINGALYSVLDVPAIRTESLILVRLTSFLSPLASHIFHFSSVSCFSCDLRLFKLCCSLLILQGFAEMLKLQMRADQPENNRKLEFTIKQLHSGQLRPLLLSSSRSYFHSLLRFHRSHYTTQRGTRPRKNGTGEATACDGADSDVEMADDEEQYGMEPDLDLNKVVRTEAGERSGERLLLGEFYAPSRPPTAGGTAGGLSNGSRAGSARGGGLINAGAAGDALLMRPLTPSARHAAAETFHKEEPVAAAFDPPRLRRWTQT